MPEEAGQRVAWDQTYFEENLVNIQLVVQLWFS